MIHRRGNLTKPRSCGLILALLCLLYLLHLRHNSHPESATSVAVNDLGTTSSSDVGLISFVSGVASKNLAATVETYERYAQRHGYSFFLERNEVDPGPWYQTLSLLKVLLEQLANSPEKRLQWLMLFDSKSLIINPDVPLEIFLSPPGFEDIHCIITKQHKQVDTTTFFIRVHPWSVRLLSKLLAADGLKPGWEAEEDAYSSTLAAVLNERGIRSNVLFQPRAWYNTYQKNGGFEGKPGDLLVHFSQDDDDVEAEMEFWLERLEDERMWNVPVEDTTYLKEVKDFWETLGNAGLVLSSAQEYLKSLPEVDWDTQLVEAVDKLWYAIHHSADRRGAVSSIASQVWVLLEQVKKSSKSERPGKSRHISKHGHPREKEDNPSEADDTSPQVAAGALSKAPVRGGYDSPQARMGHVPKGSGGEPLKKHDRMDAGDEKPYGKKAPGPKQSIVEARKTYK